MTRPITLLTCAFVSALLLFSTTPEVSYAGTMAIYNKNCSKRLLGIKEVNRITVAIDGYPGCTHTEVTVNQGITRTVTLAETTDKFSGGRGSTSSNSCRYTHEAIGTGIGRVGTEMDVEGDQFSSVTCKKDWIGDCQCIKD